MPGQPLHADTIANIRELRYVDGLTREQIRERTGVSVRTSRKYAPGAFVGKVPNTLARELFVASGLSACAVALDLGWSCTDGTGRVKGDGSRLRRTLGLLAEARGHGENRVMGFRRMIDAEVAGLIAEACGHHSWEAIPDETTVAA